MERVGGGGKSGLEYRQLLITWLLQLAWLLIFKDYENSWVILTIADPNIEI